MSLQAFFKDNAIQADEITRIVVSERFKDENGEPIKWELKPVPPKRFMRLTSGAVKVSKKGEVDTGNVDDMTFQLIAETVKFPNLRDEALQNSYGVMNTADLLNAMLSTKEFQYLYKAVNNLHVTDKSLDEMVDEVKND